MNLSNEVKITKVKAGQATATTEVSSDAIDMSGYEGVIFMASIATANAGNYLKVEQGKDANFTEHEDVKGSKVVPPKDAEVAFVDIYKPAQSQGKYLRAAIVRTATTVTGDIYAIQYNGRNKPEVNVVEDKMSGVLLISPDLEAIT